MRPVIVLVTLFLAACTGKGDSAADTGLHGGDTCTTLTTANWTIYADAFNMGDEPMKADLAFDAASCSFSFSNWDMAMDDLPSGGVVDAEAVQFDGINPFWRTCTGTATDENTASGTCSDDGSAWSMSYVAVGG